jgi:hypothetical protein
VKGDVNVYSAIGTLVYSDKVNGKTYELNRNKLAEGVYFINVTTPERTYTYKVIIND